MKYHQTLFKSRKMLCLVKQLKLAMMVCALFGTVGIIKLIKRFFPFINLPQNQFRTNEKGENNHDNAKGGNKK